MARRALGLALVLLAGCGAGEAAIGCATDEDCPSGARCKAQVCVDFRNGFDAAVPDLTSGDLSAADLAVRDLEVTGFDGSAAD